MTSVNHPVEQEEVMAYLDGELSPQMGAAVEAHLEQCVQCGVLAEDLRQVSLHLLAWESESAPATLSQAVTECATRERWAEKLNQPDSAIPALQLSHIPRWILFPAGGLAVVLLVIFATMPMNLERRAVGLADRFEEWIAPEVQMAVPRSSPTQPRPPVPQVEAEPSLRTRIAGGGAEGHGEKRVEYGRIATGAMIIRTASLVVVTKDFEATRGELERLAQVQGAYFAQLNVVGGRDSGRTLTAVVRVPSEKLTALLAELKRLGRVEQESQAGEEITQQYVDLGARLTNARNTEKRLIEVLQQRTGKVKDVLDVELEIARVREVIEQMEAQRKSYDNRVRFATVDLSLREDYKAPVVGAPPSTGTLLHNAMVEGYRAAVGSAINLAWFALRVVPVLLLWTAILWWPARRLWQRLQVSAKA